MSTSPPRQPRRRPTVGLDAPCRKCGKPIYFNYKGPVEGLCGRCADGARTAARIRSSRRIGFFEGKRNRRRIAILAAILTAAIAAAAFLALSFL